MTGAQDASPLNQRCAAYSNAVACACIARQQPPDKLLSHRTLLILTCCRQQDGLRASIAAYWEAMRVAEAAADAWLLQQQGSSDALDPGDSATAGDGGALFRAKRRYCVICLPIIPGWCPQLAGEAFLALLGRMTGDLLMVGGMFGLHAWETCAWPGSCAACMQQQQRTWQPSGEGTLSFL